MRIEGRRAGSPSRCMHSLSRAPSRAARVISSCEPTTPIAMTEGLAYHFEHLQDILSPPSMTALDFTSINLSAGPFLCLLFALSFSVSPYLFPFHSRETTTALLRTEPTSTAPTPPWLIDHKERQKNQSARSTPFSWVTSKSIITSLTSTLSHSLGQLHLPLLRSGSRT